MSTWTYSQFSDRINLFRLRRPIAELANEIIVSYRKSRNSQKYLLEVWKNPGSFEAQSFLSQLTHRTKIKTFYIKEINSTQHFGGNFYSPNRSQKGRYAGVAAGKDGWHSRKSGYNGQARVSFVTL